jgi:pyruvate, orthophosphate dikinase
LDTKYVYDFKEGNRGMKDLLGGKGANLAEMTGLGIPVPPGFTITTEACFYYAEHGTYPAGLAEEIDEHLSGLEERMGKKLGDPDDPLLVSVRSGARVSMPGMMDTVLNLGLNDESVAGLARQTDDERFAFDSYRRFIQMFSEVVMGVEGEGEQKGKLYENAINEIKKEKGVKLDTELSASELREMVERFKSITRKWAGRDFPQDPKEQMDQAIRAVFQSWNNKRAVDYRKIYKIPDDWGTAVNVQSMVFGNKGEESATGVAFTRDPATGEKERYGDFLVNAQGEDVVAGIRNTEPIDDLGDKMPGVAGELEDIMSTLEEHYKDMCDIEFTIEGGKLWMLQTRSGKRTAAAALKIAVDMFDEGLISKEEALFRIDPYQMDQLLHPQFDSSASYDIAASGMNASPGAAVGKVVFDSDTAESAAEAGEDAILVRWETTPDDLHGMVASKGILTSHGGKTSHAAVVARGMGKPCVCGASDIYIEEDKKRFSAGGAVVEEGDVISIDGTTGEVVIGEVPLVEPKVTGNFNRVLEWADEVRKLGVWSNADTPEDAARAREFGAEGIGLCRTEHMFLGDRQPVVQRIILAEKSEDAADDLARLLELQRSDFIGIFEAMDGLPVTIRLLDPPLHEFMPDEIDLEVELAVLKSKGNASPEEIAEKEKFLQSVKTMTEANPMLGLRGCRLGITFPEEYNMQVRAIIEAACERKAAGGEPVVEIMIPLVSIYTELETLRKEAEGIIEQVFEEKGMTVDYRIGTMVELPRAALTADEIARFADFFSFGTNDLTQTTFGFSRDDIEAKFLPRYLERKILKENPFETIDVEGVGKLVEMGTMLGRETKPDLKVGICGEHGGDPRSIGFCARAGLDYVSCSPFRVPVARLAAAQAALETESE